MIERIAAGIHRIHGTRGLLAAAAVLLAMGLSEPLLPTWLAGIVVVTLIFALLTIGAGTLPREGVALQRRVVALAGRSDAVRMLWTTAAWPAVLALFMQPRIFLGAYGVPHMSPLTGVVPPEMQQQVSHVFLFALLLVMVAYLRHTRHYALGIVPLRPIQMRRLDDGHRERDALLWMGLGVLLVYGALLRPFWEPFSLAEWPPGFSSLESTRGIASITFAIVPPLLMFTSITGHAMLLRHETLKGRRPIVAASIAHIGLCLLVVALHAYNLLWIAQYRAAARF